MKVQVRLHITFILKKSIVYYDKIPIKLFPSNLIFPCMNSDKAKNSFVTKFCFPCFLFNAGNDAGVFLIPCFLISSIMFCQSSHHYP